MTMSLVDHYWDSRYKLEKHPCAHCKGTGHVRPMKLVSYRGTETIPKARKCVECLGDGFRTFRVKR
jgi:hypothetical protein